MGNPSCKLLAHSPLAAEVEDRWQVKREQEPGEEAGGRRKESGGR